MIIYINHKCPLLKAPIQQKERKEDANHLLDIKLIMMRQFLSTIALHSWVKLGNAPSALTQAEGQRLCDAFLMGRVWSALCRRQSAQIISALVMPQCHW